MNRDSSTNRFPPENRNGSAPARVGNGSGGANGGAGGYGSGLGAVTGNANGQGKAHDRLAPNLASTAASAVVRPVPGGEHKGMLKLVAFTQPANGTVTRNADQTLTFRPEPGFTGKDSFAYTLRDEAGTIFSATVTVAVTLDVPAAKPAPARAPSLRALGSLSATPPAKTGEALPRLHGGAVPSPGE